jgi:hypothetical protein
MQFTTTALLTLLSTALAAPTPQTTVTPDATVPWTTTNYGDGCSLAACIYWVNISFPNPPPTDFGPAFNTYCTGNDIQSKLVACEDPSVQSNVEPASGTDGILVIQRTFEEMGRGWRRGILRLWWEWVDRIRPMRSIMVLLLHKILDGLVRRENRIDTCRIGVCLESKGPDLGAIWNCIVLCIA